MYPATRRERENMLNLLENRTIIEYFETKNDRLLKIVGEE